MISASISLNHSRGELQSFIANVNAGFVMCEVSNEKSGELESHFEEIFWIYHLELIKWGKCFALVLALVFHSNDIKMKKD